MRVSRAWAGCSVERLVAAVGLDDRFIHTGCGTNAIRHCGGYLARAESLINVVAGPADRGRMDQAEMVP